MAELSKGEIDVAVPQDRKPWIYKYKVELKEAETSLVNTYDW